jgi:hypothetical protein
MNTRSMKKRAAHLTGLLRSQKMERTSTEIISDVFLALCEAANTPVSLGRWLRYKHREFLQLVLCEVDPLDYTDENTFLGDYQATKFLSKFPHFETGLDREAIAFEKWISAESSCRETNERFRSRWAQGFLPTSSRVESVLHMTQRKITEILGAHPPRDILLRGRFGPGADLDTHRSKIDAYYKLAGAGSCTPGLLDLLVKGYEDDDRRLDAMHSAELTWTSKLTFVPKTAKTDRAICIEPRWNIFTQLAVGDYMAHRLALNGVDITNQATNQDLARSAWSLGLATVDLTSASDTISKNLVLDLFPEDWCEILFSLRCPRTAYKGQVYDLEKISSMGNGYTFPLETILFYSIARSCTDYLGLAPWYTNAYGDDLIVPSAAYELLVEVLTYCGFSVNTGKSYNSGPFYESCGSDYFYGKNVRPIFLKDHVDSVEKAYRLANQITELARRRGGYRYADRRYLGARRAVVDGIPADLRLLGPINGGDAFIHSTFDQCRPYLSPPKGGWEGYQLLGLVNDPPRFYADGDALIFSKISAPSFPGNFVSRRESGVYRVKTLVVHKYDDFLVI